MFDLPLTIVDGILCAAAILVAAHLPTHKGRIEAVALAALLLVLFLVCATGWTAFGRAQAAGFGLKVKEVWAILDALYGCAAVAIAFRYWWAWALWAICVVQEFWHYAQMLYDLNENVYPDLYSNGLTWMLWAQIALFLLIGGRYARDGAANLCRHIAGLRVLRGTGRAA